jgi:hypothetical protein
MRSIATNIRLIDASSPDLERLIRQLRVQGWEWFPSVTSPLVCAFKFDDSREKAPARRRSRSSTLVKVQCADTYALAKQ